MNKKAYLRGRPFLIVTTSYRPGAGRATTVKNWGKEPSAWTMDEIPLLTDHISNKTMASATVIIDVVNAKMIKNRYDTEDDQVMAHYLSKFREQTKQALSLWMDKQKHSMQRDMLLSGEVPEQPEAPDDPGEQLPEQPVAEENG
jgi:hypothetical protein